MNTIPSDFLIHVKNECRRHDVTIKLRLLKFLRIEHGLRVSGYFDTTTKVLAVAMKHPDALEIFVHEYAHLTQWVDDPKWFESTTIDTQLVDDWLAGKEIPNVCKNIDVLRDLELDNEKRSVKIIKKFNLPIHVPLYIKKANTYIHFYNWLKQSRRWPQPTNQPYMNKALIAACSDKFNMKYDSLTPRLERIFREQNI